MRLGALLALIPMCALGGCVGAPPRPPEFALAAGTIHEAQAAGAGLDSRASRYLACADDELARSRAELERGHLIGARSWAMQAAADAEVARMMALELSARREARRAWAEVMRLEDKLEEPQDILLTIDARGAFLGAGAAH
jgi:hypothetical protein